MRARARARKHMSAWVRACERRRGCVHASTSVVACMQAQAWVRARKRGHRSCMQAQVQVCACERGRECVYVRSEHANGQAGMQAGE